MPSLSLNTSRNLLQSTYNVYQQKFSLTQANLAQQDIPNYIAEDMNLQTSVVGGVVYNVRVSAVTQNVHENIFTQLRAQNTTLGGLKVIEAYRSSVNTIFGDKNINNALPHLSQNMCDALKIFSSRQDLGDGQNVLSRMKELVSGMKNMTDTIQQQRLDADADINRATGIVNDLLKQIAQVHDHINHLSLSNDGGIFPYLNQRRDLLQQLSAYVPLNEDVFNATPYQTVITDCYGNTLVDDNVCAEFVFDSTSEYKTNTVGKGLTLKNIPGNSTPYVYTDASDSGSTVNSPKGALAALLNVRDVILPTMQQELDGYATVFINACNGFHNQGVALNPPKVLTGACALPDGTSTGNVPAGTIPITLDTVISGKGTVRIGLAGGADGKMTAFADIALQDDMTIQSLLETINSSSANVTASLTQDGRLQLSSNDPTQGVIIGTTDQVNWPQMSASDTFNVKRCYGFSHFFGLNNLFVSDSNPLGSSPNGICETLAVRPDIVSPRQLATGFLNPDKAVGDQVLLLGNTQVIEHLSNLMSGTYIFQSNTLVFQSMSTLKDYSENFVQHNLYDTKQIITQLTQQEYIFDGLSEKAENISGVNEQNEVYNAMQISTSISYVVKMLSLLNKIEQEVLDL